MLYKTDELLLLENLTYFENEAPFTGILYAKGKTVAEYINAIDFEKILLDKDYASYMTGFDFKNLALAVKNHKNIMNAKILDTHYDQAYGGGGGVSAIFLNEENKEAVIAFRGTAANEWADDFVASNQVDSLQQINAMEWYKKMVEQYDLTQYTITLTGHSKGGNKAKYITILEDTPSRCVSFDGQGFSDVFMEYYKDKILLHQKKIENHNIDFDYVNIILNDVGRKTYYIGYDYGKGGFAEAHCPNTFFDFKENGEYEIRINPNGQRAEMQILDQFINSMSRSDTSDKERTETAKLIGILVERAFQIGSDEKHTKEDYINFLCDLIRDETYSNNTAFVLAFIIKYSQENPLFLQALKDIMTHFKMDDITSIVDTIKEIMESDKINRIVNLSNFLALHVSHIATKTVQQIAKKKYNLNLTKEQVQGILMIIAMTKETLKTLKINKNGSDIIYMEDEVKPETLELENLNIVILAGGLSVQRNISLKTGTEIKNALKSSSHKVILLDSFMGYKSDEEIKNPFDDPEKYSYKESENCIEIADLWAVKKRRQNESSSYFGPNVIKICEESDLVFIALDGADAENGKLQAAFDLLGITYTGCDYFSSALSSNKIASKVMLSNSGIPVMEGFALRRNAAIFNPEENGLKFPVIVKPCFGDLGMGISLASSYESYKNAINDAFLYDDEILVEEYVMGREFSVSTINGIALPVIEKFPLNTREIETNSDLLETAVKKCPADISPVLSTELKRIALKASKILGCTPYSKTDFIVGNDGKIHCIECDSLPDLSMEGEFYTEARTIGISYPDFCKMIINTLLEK